MENFYFIVSGKPHFIQKIYNKVKNSLSDFDYSLDEYSKYISLPRGSSEIEVLDKKGYNILYLGEGFSIYSTFSTNFFRKDGRIFGKDSKLMLEIKSTNPSKLVKISSKISEVDPIFQCKKNFSFELEKSDELDLI